MPPRSRCSATTWATFVTTADASGATAIGGARQTAEPAATHSPAAQLTGAFHPEVPRPARRAAADALARPIWLSRTPRSIVVETNPPRKPLHENTRAGERDAMATVTTYGQLPEA